MHFDFHVEAHIEFLEAVSRYEAEVTGLGARFVAELERCIELLLGEVHYSTGGKQANDYEPRLRAGLSRPLPTASPVSETRRPWTRRGKVQREGPAPMCLILIRSS
ncbi:MAG: hypothetical protein ACREX9_13625 [Gammaproteobacteria bacterium]